jgi:Lrp/AsnC family transcriptional regulator for asnA, asnC and gidA
MAKHELDSLDEKILRIAVGDTRLPFLEIARRCDVSGAAIHMRMNKLTKMGVIKGTALVVDNMKVGYETCAYVGVYLNSPGDFASVVEGLEKIPEVVECHYTTGSYDLFIKIFAHNNQHLLDIIHQKLQPLKLARTETLISLKEAFSKHIPINFTGEAD